MPTHPPWVLLHPRATPHHLGYLPGFLELEDERPAREQFNERYIYGGWDPWATDKCKMLDGYRLAYPGDPIFKPIAACFMRNETILLYEHDVVAIVQEDGTFEVARMD